MAHRHRVSVSRRTFLQGAGLAGAGTLLGSQISFADAAQGELPTRILGRTGQKVTTLALGTYPAGWSSDLDIEAASRLVDEALDLGINFVDAARIYGRAENAIGRILGDRRDKIFLTTKVWADDAKGAEKALEESLQDLKTDHVDLVYIHSIGNRNVQQVMGPGGSLEYLLKQKQAGRTRFVGISGHHRPKTFIPLLETGEIDVLMPAMNFVDRHTYDFEETVLPVAKKHHVGIACMKVFGGVKGGFTVVNGPNPGPTMPQHLLQPAVRYALGLPDVATLVIGPHTVQQLRENVRMVKEYQPLSESELSDLMKIGQQLAVEWGPHFGSVV
jgi:predicted aldo/keto reductase-like oxidoreductase